MKKDQYNFISQGSVSQHLASDVMSTCHATSCSFWTNRNVYSCFDSHL